MHERNYQCFICSVIAAVLLANAFDEEAKAAPVLPDLIAWASEDKGYMYGGSLNPSRVPGETVYSFTGALPNIGPGKLEVRDVTHPNLTQDVFQRIYDENGQFDHERLIGSFPNSDSVAPRHLWLPGIAQYNLRAVLAGNGVGDILTSQDKISMAVVDSAAYDKSLPGAPQNSVYNSVSLNPLGISIGWADVYSNNLPGQWVPATGLAAGQYWLEVTVDPHNRIEEANETNNTTRILITLPEVPAPTILAGDYNRDGSVDAADYTVWRNSLGQTNLGLQGQGADGDASGTIRQADFDVWKAHVGDGAGSGSGGIAVPEPASLTAAAIALLGALGISNRGRLRVVSVQLGA
jgi:hypothetical protein